MSDEKSVIRISLTQFLNFVTKEPEKQLTVVKEIRRQHEEGYKIPPDLYKQFREGIINFHKDGLPKSELDRLASSQTEDSRKKHYPVLVEGYKKFLGRKNITWFNPPRGYWQFNGLKINVSPELGLSWNGDNFAIKLYLSQSDDLVKRRAEIITQLIYLAIPNLPQSATPMILDVRKSKKYIFSKAEREQTALLRAQARAIISLYREL